MYKGWQKIQSEDFLYDEVFSHSSGFVVIRSKNQKSLELNIFRFFKKKKY